MINFLEIIMEALHPQHISERRHYPERRANTRPLTASKMNTADWIAMSLLIIGGLNWGLVGLFNFDLVAALFGEMSLLSRVVYTVVGLSAMYSVFTSGKMARR